VKWVGMKGDKGLTEVYNNKQYERQQLSSFVMFAVVLPHCSQQSGTLHSLSLGCGVDVAHARLVGDMALPHHSWCAGVLAGCG
jgi:hypothetical protein